MAKAIPNSARMVAEARKEGAVRGTVHARRETVSERRRIVRLGSELGQSCAAAARRCHSGPFPGGHLWFYRIRYKIS